MKYLEPIALTILAVATPCAAQIRPGQVCSLMTEAEVKEALTGRVLIGGAEASTVSGGQLCTYYGADVQVLLFTEPRADEHFSAFLSAFRRENLPHHPVPELGSGAFVIFNQPRDEYEDNGAMVVTRVGQYLLAVSVTSKKGEPGEAVRPIAVKLAKRIADRLRGQ